MRRVNRLTLAFRFMLPACVAVLLVATACRGVLAADAQPNIIFLLTDDQRWDTLGCMGNKIVETPNIDRLANQGVIFDNCFVTTSICMTNRACIFTGQYAARHGVINFSTNFTDAQLANTYPAQLKQAGYYIGFIGKWGVGKPPQNLFDYNKGWPGQNKYLNMVDGQFRHLTSIMSDQAMEFLDGVPGDRPFCLAFSTKAPHCQDGPPQKTLDLPQFKGLYAKYPSQFFYDPKLAGLYAGDTIPPAPLSDPAFFEAMPEFLRKSENRIRWEIRFATPEQYQETVKAYYRLISGVDQVMGRIVDKLREKGVADNTIIVYSGDNGFYLGERGFAGKWFPHEVSIRVPLIVYDPRLPAAQKGQRREETVLSIDIAPTILAEAGVKPPAVMQGVSLVPLVRGEKPKWRTEFYYEHLFEHATIPRNEGVRDAEYKYIRYIDSDPLYEELYHLTKDPDEGHNLAQLPEYAGKLEEMRQKWAAWRQKVK